MTREQIVAAIAAELDRAYKKHGRDQWGRHEFYGVIAEEFEEMWEDIKRDAPDSDLHTEIVQVAAMCFRFLETGDRYKTDGSHGQGKPRSDLVEEIAQWTREVIDNGVSVLTAREVADSIRTRFGKDRTT